MILVFFSVQVTNTRHSKKTAKPIENDVPDDAQKKRKIQDVEVSTKDEEVKKMKALRESFERMEQPVTVDKILYVLSNTIVIFPPFFFLNIFVCNCVSLFDVSNLKDMEKCDILKTFDQHESILRSKFKSYSKVPDQKFEPRKEELDYLLILDALIDGKGDMPAQMYQKVRDRFCPSDGITSNVSVIDN